MIRKLIKVIETSDDDNKVAAAALLLFTIGSVGFVLLVALILWHLLLAIPVVLVLLVHTYRYATKEEE